METYSMRDNKHIVHVVLDVAAEVDKASRDYSSNAVVTDYYKLTPVPAGKDELELEFTTTDPIRSASFLPRLVAIWERRLSLYASREAWGKIQEVISDIEEDLVLSREDSLEVREAIIDRLRNLP